MSESAKEAILEAARRTAQAHGYGGLNFRDIAAEVGIESASIYHHFPSKADLGGAVAKRYWENTAAYPGLFRSRADLHLFNSLIASFRESGLILGGT